MKDSDNVKTCSGCVMFMLNKDYVFQCVSYNDNYYSHQYWFLREDISVNIIVYIENDDAVIFNAPQHTC